MPINKVPPVFREKMSEEVYQACKKEYKYGTVYVGSPCNLKCFYCSEFWNPPGLIPDPGGFLTVDEVKHFLTYVLDGSKTLDYIGASITRPGEFFLHPQSLEILKHLKEENFTLNLVDTNGMHIREEHAKVLVGGWIRNVAIHLLNYDQTEKALHFLDEYDVRYYINIVPTQNIIDSGQVESWIQKLQSNNPKFITLSRPGYTKFTPPKLVKKMLMSDGELWFFAEKLQKMYPDIPIDVDLDLSTYGVAGAEILKSVQFFIKHYLEGENLVRSKVLFLTAKSVEAIFEGIIETCTPFKDYRVFPVENRTFGGSANAAGLLTVEDYIAAIEETLETGYRPDFIVCSVDSFLYDNEDLRGVPPSAIEDKFKIPVIPC